MDRIFGNATTTGPTWKLQPNERGTFSVLSTCIVTLALCVWTAVHLNIPEHGGRWQQVWRKCGWMALAFLAPEIVAFTAYNQFIEARSITKEMKTLWSRPRSDTEWKKPLDIEEPEIIPVQNDVESLVAAISNFPESHSPYGFSVVIYADIQQDHMWWHPGPLNATIRLRLGENLQGISFQYALPSFVAKKEPEESRPYVDLVHADIWRWRLAFRGLWDTNELARHTLSDRILNFPRLKNPSKKWPLYFGFGIIGLVYGGLHCFAWDASFSTHSERLLWRISSVTVTSTGAFIALCSIWLVDPPFWKTLPHGPGLLLWESPARLPIMKMRAESSEERKRLDMIQTSFIEQCLGFAWLIQKIALDIIIVLALVFLHASQDIPCCGVFYHSCPLAGGGI